jgi:hypothetical protein
VKSLFRQQLETSADGFLWAVGQIPTGRHYVLPLPIFGTLPAARIVFRVVWYEQQVALPYMRTWVSGAPPDIADTEAQDWHGQDMADLVAQFRQGRDEQIALLNHLSEWDSVRPTLWGPVPLSWLLTKTYQHTLEHTTTLLNMALYWDQLLAAQ